MEYGTYSVTVTVTIVVLLTGVSEAAHQSRESNRSHFSQAREGGRTILHNLTNLFTKRGKRNLTNVSANHWIIRSLNPQYKNSLSLNISKIPFLRINTSALFKPLLSNQQAYC